MSANESIRFSKSAETKVRIGPKSMIAPLAETGRGLISSVAKVNPIKLNAIGVAEGVEIDPWLLWEHLGDFALVSFGELPLEFKIPDPIDMLRELETVRRQWLNMLNVGPEQIGLYVRNPANLPAEQLAGAMKKSAPAYLCLIDVVLLYVRKRWDLEKSTSSGDYGGLFEEIALVANLLPPKNERAPESQKVLERFAVEVERGRGQRLPDLGHHTKTVARDGHRARELSDPKRISWYLELPSYLQILTLAPNRYNYVVLVFSDNRFIVDTRQKENRVFLFRGTCEEVTAQIDAALRDSSIKSSLESASLCVAAYQHDEAGLHAVREFLS